MSDLLKVNVPGVGNGVLLVKKRCNIFGDDINGARRVLGGLETGKPRVQWYCENEPAGRFRMECEHGHRGQIMEPCESHWRQFSGGKVTFCPRCNMDPEKGHNCKLKIVPVS